MCCCVPFRIPDSSTLGALHAAIASNTIVKPHFLYYSNYYTLTAVFLLAVDTTGMLNHSQKEKR